MKTIKTNSKHYEVTCNVCFIGDNGMAIEEYECVSNSKSEVKIKKSIRDAVKAEGYKVIGIDNIAIERVNTVTTYKFDIDTDALIELLIASEIAYTVE